MCIIICSSCMSLGIMIWKYLTLYQLKWITVAVCRKTVIKTQGSCASILGFDENIFDSKK